MCLGIPGKLIELHDQDDPLMGRVDFGGIVKETCLAYTPEAKVGEYVIVHAGFAISRVDENEAQEIFSYLEQLGAAADLDEPSTALPPSTGGDSDEVAT